MRFQLLVWVQTASRTGTSLHLNWRQGVDLFQARCVQCKYAAGLTLLVGSVWIGHRLSSTLWSGASLSSPPLLALGDRSSLSWVVGLGTSELPSVSLKSSQGLWLLSQWLSLESSWRWFYDFPRVRMKFASSVFNDLKCAFCHQLQTLVLSLANPFVDFLLTSP